MAATAVVVATISAYCDKIGDDLPVEVFYGWLFVGSVCAARNAKALKAHGITHVFSMIGPPEHPIEGITYGYVDIYDSDRQSLSKSIRTFLDFVQSANKQSRDTRILVHCHAGISRSVSMIVALLITEYGYSYNDALAHIRRHRPEAEPNPGFEKQLRALIPYSGRK